MSADRRRSGAMARAAFPALTGLGLLLSGEAVAQARAPRTFVATTGSDANQAGLCSRSAPCRSLDAALAVTDFAGELVILDSGGFGPAVVTGDVTLTAPAGVHAAITQTSPGGAAIRVASRGSVLLRGLTLLGGNRGAAGVLVEAAGDLTIERCAIEGFQDAGIRLQPSPSLPFPNTVVVRDTSVRRSFVGIRADQGRLSLQDVRLESNLAGAILVQASATIGDSVIAGNSFEGVLLAEAGARASIADTVIAQNRRGVAVNAGEATLVRCAVDDNTAEGVDVAAGARATVDGSTLRGNATGLEVEGTAMISASVVTGNQTGLKNDGGLLQTRRDNTVTRNTANVTGVLTPVGSR